jgi:hypothetical protein
LQTSGALRREIAIVRLSLRACDLTLAPSRTIERADLFIFSRKQDPDDTRALYH